MAYKKQFCLDGLSADEITAKIRNSALGSLSMREHSVSELETKLQQKFEAHDLVAEVIGWLLDLDYLNDQRYSAMYARSSVVKGRGPVRIQQELRHKGVANQLISAALQQAEVDWLSEAEVVLSRKFRSAPVDAKEKAKQIRYLQARGFTPDHIYPLF